MNRMNVGVLGATGTVGQHFIRLLENHPQFNLVWLGGSDRSAGKPYNECTTWRLDGKLPDYVARIVVSQTTDSATEVDGKVPKLLFSAMDASVATEIERAYAAVGRFVVSNSRNHRMEDDVPLVIPEVNPGHLGVLPLQQAKRKWRGAIVTNSNCSTMVLALALAPLRAFGIRRVIASTLQAVSGAGYPGVPSLDILGNVIPFIGGEEEKMQSETQKILGRWDGSAFHPHPAAVSAQCHRVAVIDGHTVSVSVELERSADEAALLEAWRNFRGTPQERKLPSAPDRPVEYLPQPDRPQARRDASLGNGMTVSIGRLRPCPVLGWKFVACGHNAIRGAAGAAVLNAELMLSEGLLS